MPKFCIEIDDVQQASHRIAAHVIRTPSVHSESLSRMTGCDVFLKAENLQHVGAFKARGAMNAVMSLSPEVASRGVVTHSSGNHAAALARAAALLDVPAHVVMPSNSSPKKVAAVKSYGVEPVFCQPTTEARQRAAEDLRVSTGGTMVHPYDTPGVMAGQGTVGMEILDQVQGVDAIFVPVGGGGLLSGVLTVVKSMCPRVKVIAVEPEFADDTFRSLQSGQRQMPTRYDSIADGLRTAIGENTFPIVRHYIDEILLVTEEAIGRAMRLIAEEARLVAEPSGAVALAGLMMNSQQFAGKRIAVVISGGNLSFGNCGLGG